MNNGWRVHMEFVKASVDEIKQTLAEVPKLIDEKFNKVEKQMERRNSEIEKRMVDRIKEATNNLHAAPCATVSQLSEKLGKQSVDIGYLKRTMWLFAVMLAGVAGKVLWEVVTHLFGAP